MREPSRMLAAAAQVAWPGLMILAPFLLLLAAVGLAADLLVGGLVVSARPVTPDFTRINPLKGFGRLFSHAALAEIVKALVKFAVVGAVAAWLMRSWLADFLHLAAETWPYARPARRRAGDARVPDPRGRAGAGDTVGGAVPGLAVP